MQRARTQDQGSDASRLVWISVAASRLHVDLRGRRLVGGVVYRVQRVILGSTRKAAGLIW